jgi:hypothetical protein
VIARLAALLALTPLVPFGIRVCSIRDTVRVPAPRSIAWCTTRPDLVVIGDWVEIRRGRRPVATGSLVSWRRVALQAVGCGLAVAAILVLRSRTSLDFIYFQF